MAQVVAYDLQVDKVWAAGECAAIVISLVQSANLNGHEPWAYLKDVLQRLHTHPNRRIWQPAS